MTYKYPLLALFSVVALVGCSDKVSTTTTAGDTYSTSSSYTLPSTLEVTKDSAAESSSSASYAVFGDADTDYTKHVTNSFVDGDIEALEMINEVLQVINDSGYKDYVNKGPYKALVTTPGGEDHKSQGGGAKGDTKVEKLSPMTVNVTRADGTDEPMKIDFWMTMSEDMGPDETFDINVKGHIEVTKGADDDTLPWGVFTFNVQGSGTLPGIGETTLFSMAIKTIENADGKAEMEFIDGNSFPSGEGGSLVASSNAIHVIANKALTSGNMRMIQDGEYTEDLYVTFNDDYYMVKDSSDDPNEYSKKLADMTKRVYEYALFNKATGAKISLNAGMPFKTADGGFGYAGNWGVWAENQSLIVDGAEVTSQGASAAAYTVVAKKGKLIKHTKVSKTLSDIDGLNLSLYQCGESGCSENMVQWSNALDLFQIIGTKAPNADGNYVTTLLESPVTLTTSNIERWGGAWVESLSTMLQIGHYIHDGGTLNDATTITYHVESTVLPGATDAPSTLYTKEWVPDYTVASAGLLAANRDSHWSCWDRGDCLSTLTYDTDEYMLKSGSTELVPPSTLDLSTSEFSWGVHMWGLLVNSTDDPHTVDVFYSWQTGKDSWNKFTSLKDAESTMVVFDQPVRMTYTHSTANDRNADATKDGMLYQIDYDGQNLGIPWNYDVATDDWQPEISLADGTVLTDGTTEYVVKASDVSLSMKMLSTGDVAYVSGLTVDVTTSDPTITFNAAVIAAMPTEPTLDSDGTALKVKVSKGKTIE